MTGICLQDALEIQAKIASATSRPVDLQREYLVDKETVRKIKNGDFFDRKDAVTAGVSTPSNRKKSKYTPKTSKWTEELEDEVERLWAEGLSASQIADRVQAGFSRNAVIGKVHRMDLPARAKRCTDPNEKERRKKTMHEKQVAAHRKSRGTKMPFTQRGPKAVQPERPPAPEKPVSLDITFVELEPFHCHWIENEDTRDPLYCGHAVVVEEGERTSWCPYHKHVLHYGSGKPVAVDKTEHPKKSGLTLRAAGRGKFFDEEAA